MNRGDNFDMKVAAAVIAAIFFFISLVYMGNYIGIQEDLRTIMIAGGLLASLLLAIFTWKTNLSALGILFFFLVMIAGEYTKLEPEDTLLFSVFACLGAGLFLMVAKAFRE